MKLNLKFLASNLSVTSLSKLNFMARLLQPLELSSDIREEAKKLRFFNFLVSLNHLKNNFNTVLFMCEKEKLRCKKVLTSCMKSCRLTIQRSKVLIVC